MVWRNSANSTPAPTEEATRFAWEIGNYDADHSNAHQLEQTPPVSALPRLASFISLRHTKKVYEATAVKARQDCRGPGSSHFLYCWLICY